MVAAKYDFSANQGANLHLTFRWSQPPTANQTAAGEPGTAVDLTGYTARMQLRVEVTAPMVALELTTENDRILLGQRRPTDSADPANGLITLWVDAPTMEAIEAKTYSYDLELVSADGFVTRVLEGKVKISPEVTRVDPSVTP